MTPSERHFAVRAAVQEQGVLELCALHRVMDNSYSDKLANFLRTDVAIPYEVREFLADALQGKCENWRLEWRAAKPGPAMTGQRHRKWLKREQQLAVAALRACDAIENGTPVESAIATIQADAQTSRSKAYEALAKIRKALPHIQSLIAKDVPESE